jgi:hypothetical protein
MRIVSILVLFIFMTQSLKGIAAATSSYMKSVDLLEGDKDFHMRVRRKDLSINPKTSAKNLRITIESENLKALKPNEEYALEIYYFDDNANKVLVNHISPIKFKKVDTIKTNLMARLQNIKNSQYVYFDLKDSSKNLVASFAEYFNATNQLLANKLELTDTTPSLGMANCDPRNFGECQLEYIVKNLKFSFYPSTTGETIVSKKTDGSFYVYVPIKPTDESKPSPRTRLNPRNTALSALAR